MGEATVAGPLGSSASHPNPGVHMSWLGIVIVVVAGYLALKVVGGMLKLLFGALVLVGLYLVLAPMLGWSSPMG